MILYELFNPTLTELRRNPEQNEKISGHAGAVKFLQGKNLDDYGVSMTKLPKLGINPGSNYNTPVGIYFYPGKFYMRKKDQENMWDLPFLDDAPYIQIFELNGNIEEIDNIGPDKFKSYISKLYKNVGKISQLLGISEVSTEREITQAIVKSDSHAKRGDLYGGKLWYIFYTLSRIDGVAKRDTMAPRSSVIWNSILRVLGMDGVIDNGESIIHESEPYQGVIFDPRSIRHVETILNTKQAENTELSQYIYLAGIKPDSYNYVQTVTEHISKYNLKLMPNNSKYCTKIIKNVLIALRKNPSIYKQLGEYDIGLLKLIDKSMAVASELTVEYYSNKFPKFKMELDDIVAEWEDTVSDADFTIRPEIRRRRQFALIAPPRTMQKAQEVVNNLTPYKSNPAAADMINYINGILKRLEY